MANACEGVQTSKKIFEQVLMESDGQCAICGRHNGSELHHIIYGSGKRKQCERVESVVLLCMECHRGNHGIHGKYGATLNLKLKQKLQEKYFDKGYDEDKVRWLMGGRLY